MRILPAVGIVLAFVPRGLCAQGVELAVRDNGVAIGDVPRVNGLRINYRDSKLEKVNGMNVTMWSPYEPATGTVNGLALGLPMTGAGTINGIAVAPFGVGVDRSITGIGIGGLGVGGGGELRGVMIGGIGVGSGRGVTGLSVGSIGVGSGGPVRGIQLAGIGVGSGGTISGISIAGVGAGAAGDVSGLTIGGLGVGSGGTVKGITFGGLGVGAAGDVTGVTIGGLGVGSGGTLEGLSIGGLGVGAPALKGVAVGLIGAGGQDVHAIVLAGAYFKVPEHGRFDGGAVSAFNNVQGSQRGLTIGIVNYARELHGAQIGIINVSNNEGRLRVLPLLSVR